jgi:putative ABC transport system permease protein
VEYNCAYVDLPGGADVHKLSAELKNDENVTSITVHKDLKERLSNMMSSLDYVVLLIILSAAGLAFIVIYNLTNINITERIREIATIKVLGFFRSETSAYVLRENIALTGLGTALGLVLGVLLHRFVMAQIVVDMVDFNTTVQPVSFLLSVVLTFVFNFVVNLFMQLRLERINMAESLKSVD